MKQTLDLGEKTFITFTDKVVFPEDNFPICIEQKDAIKQTVYLTLSQANEMREWLNKNLPR